MRVQLANEKMPVVGDMKYGVSKESMMFLYSYYVNIPKYNIEIERDIPLNFLNKL